MCPEAGYVQLANRLGAQVEKAQKDGEKATRDRKRMRREAHEKDYRRQEREGLSQQTMPESTPDPDDSSSDEVDLEMFEDPNTGEAGGPLPAQQRAGIEASAAAAGEKEPAPATIEMIPVLTASRRSPTPAAGSRSPTPAAGRRLPTPAVGRRSPTPTVGRRVPTTAVRRMPMPVAAAAERTPVPTAGAVTLWQTPPRVQSLLIPVPFPAWFSRRATPAAAPLAPSKALKSGLGATPRTAAQPPTGGPQTVEATVTRYWEALARGAQSVRAQPDKSEAGRSSIEEAARSGAEGEAGRDSMEGAARSDTKEDTGRGSTGGAARTVPKKMGRPVGTHQSVPPAR
ncbi:translation initiation factor IF-2-like [Panicum virgatum]|uniref:translation initiation factor IF-2-like n=1 Tax=Panicum virgatum TaxID=38727 RepID=UPI0019D5BDFA|nr:translation initiation factor IF-2-like [Panicum virgatum]